MGTKLAWTPGDEKLLQSLLEQKAEFYRAKTEPVRDLFVNAPWLPQGSRTTDEIIEWAIVHADTLRDALLPFDSGVRPAKDSASSN